MDHRRAYSLTELAITLLVVLIVVSTAFAAFTRTEQAASVSSAKTELTQAAGDIRAFHQGIGYFPATAGEFKELIPSLEWTSGLAETTNEVSFAQTTSAGSPLIGFAMRASSDMCVSLTFSSAGSEAIPVRDVYEIGSGADDDGVPRGACSGAEALNRPAGGVNAW